MTHRISGTVMTVLLAFVLVVASVAGKTYERCELARELRYELDVAEDEVPIWVCIAEHESQYNTSAVGMKNADGSSDHGIFQISDLYWCSPPGRGWACGLKCKELEDDDIQDDMACARRIYKEHKHLSGNGFNAWAVYEPLCNGPRVQKYVEGCFPEGETPPPKKRTTTTTTKVYPWLLPRPTSPAPKAPCSVPAPDKTTPRSTERVKSAVPRLNSLTSFPSKWAKLFSPPKSQGRSTTHATPLFQRDAPASVFTLPDWSRYASTLSSPSTAKSVKEDPPPSPHSHKREATFIVNGRPWP